MKAGQDTIATYLRHAPTRKTQNLHATLTSPFARAPFIRGLALGLIAATLLMHFAGGAA